MTTHNGHVTVTVTSRVSHATTTPPHPTTPFSVVAEGRQVTAVDARGRTNQPAGDIR